MAVFHSGLFQPFANVSNRFVTHIPDLHESKRGRDADNLAGAGRKRRHAAARAHAHRDGHVNTSDLRTCEQFIEMDGESCPIAAERKNQGHDGSSEYGKARWLQHSACKVESRRPVFKCSHTSRAWYFTSRRPVFKCSHTSRAWYFTSRRPVFKCSHTSRAWYFTSRRPGFTCSRTTRALYFRPVHGVLTACK